MLENLKMFLCVLASALPALIYIPIIVGMPRKFNFPFILAGILGGVVAGLSILAFKLLLFKGTINPPSIETLSITIFISFIEAGLLEELFKASFYTLVFWLFFEQNSKPVYLPNIVEESKNSKYYYLVLGAFIGLGFGLMENIYYAFNTHSFRIVMDRVFTTIPAHMIMNMTFGFLRANKVNWVLALMASILIHSIYDFFALPSTLLGSILVRSVLILGFGFCLWMGKNLLFSTTATVRNSHA